MLDVCVVIVSYNTRQLLAECLRAVEKFNRPDIRVDVIVVDNASADGTADMVASDFPKVSLIALNTNIGYAAACNLGVSTGTGTHILLLNPDTVPSDDCVLQLLDEARRHPYAGVVGGRAFHEDGSVNPQSCYGMPSLWSMFCFATGLSTVLSGSPVFNPEAIPGWDRGDSREVGVVTGALLLTERALWDRVGGLSDAYFVYGEDVELSFRVRDLGYRPRITPHAEMVHVGGASSPSSARKWTMMLRGKVTFMRRCWTPRAARYGVVMLTAGTWLRATGSRLGLPMQGPWRENWAGRDDWRGGWEAVDGVPVDIAERGTDVS